MSGVRLVSEGEEREVLLQGDVAWIDGRKIPFQVVRRRGAVVAVQVDGRLAPVRVARDGDRVFVASAGRVHEVRRETGLPSARSGRGSTDHGTGPTGLVAPMPGRIRKTLLGAGEAVQRGQIVLVLEAMKMEHAIRAPRDGTVTRLDHAEGDLVEAGTVLAEIG
jgi:biotin carboxyl carrier protein